MLGLGWLQTAKSAVKPAAILSLLVASVVGSQGPVLAPGLEVQPSGITPSAEPKSLSDLYRIRDHLQTRLSEPPPMPWMVPGAQNELSAPATLAHLWPLTYRITQEEIAQRRWAWATQSAASASALGNPATLSDASVEAAYGFWYEAVDTLSQVPPDSFVAAQAMAQQSIYRHNLAIAAYRYDTTRSDFLASLAAQTGLAERLRVTVCNLDRECRRWQGDRPPANPASLIKVPVAVALTAHIYQQGISPKATLWVNPGNWTEDAGTTQVGREYTLEQIMTDMISASGNVATNQLIDYLGWAGVNQRLRDLGYTATRVSTKLVGESTYPVNPGLVANLTTTDELTDMMVGIYNQEHPGDALIQLALKQQVDRALGHAAVKPPILWLGEKTGRNSKVLGSTTAVNVSGNTYIITATLDYSANEAVLRTLIDGVIRHLLTHQGFEDDLDGDDLLATRPRSFLP
ncbi:MAG: serine hydrolase [Leptolyngbyaceae cyanobacterium SM2_5_2]|nr:serine hydrolase [Leptolyngbyaceae cyanobacterium SM2_5_2]